MFYHLRGVRAPRTSMDFQPYLIYEDIRVLGSISKARGCVCVCRGGWGEVCEGSVCRGVWGGCEVGVCVCAKRVFDWMLFNGFLSLVDRGVSEINHLINIICFAILIVLVSLIVKLM